jgi:hypothetical protein
MTTRQPPRFYGVTTYQDPLGRYSFRFPTDWLRFDLEGRDGIRVAPSADDPETWFTAWVIPLEEPAVAEDLEILRAGVADGLARLADCAVESESEVVLGNLIRFERVFTFRDGEATRKRKFWILYVDKWQIMLTWQGSSEEEFEYWLPMANYAFATFSIPEALWFATDRELFARRE